MKIDKKMIIGFVAFVAIVSAIIVGVLIFIENNKAPVTITDQDEIAKLQKETEDANNIDNLGNITGEDPSNVENNEESMGVLIIRYYDFNSPSDLVSGAEIRIYNEDNYEDYTEIIDETGELKKFLPYGKYSLSEINPPEGYYTEPIFESFELSEESPEHTIEFETEKNDATNIIAENLKPIQPEINPSDPNNIEPEGSIPDEENTSTLTDGQGGPETPSVNPKTADNSFLTGILKVLLLSGLLVFTLIFIKNKSKHSI